MQIKPFLLIILFFTLFMNNNVSASYCPKKITAFENGIAAKAYSKILLEIYQHLGCSAEIVFLPPKRGIVEFNKGKVDGELYRLAITETKYKTPFVRSGVPLYQYRAGVWRNPSLHEHHGKPLGYVRGLTWQVKYIESHPEIRAVEFDSPGNVLDAYQRGAISGFLSGEPMMHPKLANHEIFPTPILDKVLIDKPIYHYLHADYTPFMRDFSAKVEKNNFFKNVALYFD